jgi:hypothetical protein
MQSQDLVREYQAKTNDELLKLLKKADRLSPEASAYLMGEVTRRGLQTHDMTGPVAPPAVVSGNDPIAVEINLPSKASKAPWRPKTSGRIAFWFGPVGGALVVAVSLRRMGHTQRARKVLILALVVAIAEVLILSFVPERVGGLLGLAGHIFFLLFFPPLMEGEFGAWQAANQGTDPAPGWKAIGWGLVGAFAMFVVGMIMYVVLPSLIPGGE